MKLNNSTATFSSILYWLSFFLKKAISLNVVHQFDITSPRKLLWLQYFYFQRLPYGHSTSNRHGFDVDITSICQRPNLDEFPRHFRVLFWCNFDGRKIHVASTYFFRRNFAGREVHVISTYFFRCNFDGRNMHVVFTYFFRRNFDGQKLDIVLGKL